MALCAWIILRVLMSTSAATAALDQPGGGRAGYDRADPILQISKRQQRDRRR
jgi:hypothetical protein